MTDYNLDALKAAAELQRGLPPRCEHCGYSAEDSKLHGDHYLCGHPIPELTAFDCAARNLNLTAVVAEIESQAAEIAELRKWKHLTQSHSPSAAALATLKVEVESQAAEISQMKQDLHDAAGELLVSLPEPGTTEAKLLSANVLLRQEVERLKTILREQYDYEETG